MTSERRTILFLDKVFLRPCRKGPRGVEVFNLNLLRDLAVSGHRVTVGAHPTWGTLVRERCADSEIEVLETGGKGAALPGGLGLACRLARRRFDVFLLGNVANRLIPLMAVLRLLRVAPRCVVIAHREPSRRYLAAQKFWSTGVVAVNGTIADEFTEVGFESVAVRYGITEGDRFTPAGGKPAKGTTDFCVLGHLDSAWKGADTAMAAFQRLPDTVRSGCRLHLASFREPPDIPDPGINAYAWMPFDEMPAFLQRMDVMLVPSRDEEVMRETFSQVMVQGMLTGLPQIVNDLPILVEKLDKGGGLVFHSVDELASHMARLADDAELRAKLGTEARSTALERYVWDTALFVDRFLFPSEREP